jgi:serine/threonine protein kinase
MTTLGGPPNTNTGAEHTNTGAEHTNTGAEHTNRRRKRNKNKKNPKDKFVNIQGNEYKVIKTLGQGAYGKVDKVEDDEGYPFAIKRVEFHQDKGVYADIIKEMDILMRFSAHPNVIGLCGYAWDTKEFIVLMEYGGTPLHKYISNVDYNERMQVLPMVMWQIMSALDYLHNCGICHRDIKPDNILVEEFIENDGVILPHLRLCDFGLSKNMALKRNTPKTSTLWYRAPENLQKLDRYGYKIDVWAAGCLLYEYITGDVLFECDSSSSCLLKIISSLGPLSDQTYSRLRIDKSHLPKRMRRHIIKPIADSEAERLMYRMLTVDPEARPTAAQILEDNYFNIHRDKVERITTFIAEEKRARENDVRAEGAPIVPNPAYTPEIRRALVNWLLEIQVADRDETHPQTVFLGIELFDDVMSKWGPIRNESDLKYIALTCFNLASKYLELGLDLDFVYCWNNRKFHDSQGVPPSKVKEPSEAEIDDYILTLNGYEQRCLMLLDFRIGGRPTALDKNQGDYRKAKNTVLRGGSEPAQ